MTERSKIRDMIDAHSNEYTEPYKRTHFNQWEGLIGIQAVTDIQGLIDDLERWKTMIDDGRGKDASREINEILVQFQKRTPQQRFLHNMVAANRRFSESKSDS